MELKEVGDIEVPQDLEFQRREWRVQRIVWVIMALIVVLGAAGGFGRGPLARASVSAPDGSFEVQYNRFVRHLSAEHIEIMIRQPPRDTIGLTFEAEHLRGIELQSIEPEPVGTRAAHDRITYEFVAGAGARIYVRYRPDQAWARQASITLEGASSVRLKQFVFP